MAGTSLGARFYRQIKRHPGVSSIPRAQFPSCHPASQGTPHPKSCFLFGFLSVPKFSRGHSMLCLCNVAHVPAACLGQDHCRVRDTMLKMWL